MLPLRLDRRSPDVAVVIHSNPFWNTTSVIATVVVWVALRVSLAASLIVADVVSSGPLPAVTVNHAVPRALGR